MIFSTSGVRSLAPVNWRIPGTSSLPMPLGTRDMGHALKPGDYVAVVLALSGG